MSRRNPARRENPKMIVPYSREMSNHFLPLLRPGGTVHISRNNPTDLWKNARATYVNTAQPKEKKKQECRKGDRNSVC
jgi:hypothetical protein